MADQKLQPRILLKLEEAELKLSFRLKIIPFTTGEKVQ